MKEIFTLSSDVLPASSRVVGFRGTEAISKPYSFEIFIVLTSDQAGEFDMADAINAQTTLTMHRDDGRPPFVFHGILASIDLVQEFGGRAFFRATLVPKLWTLTQTLHSNIFTQKSIPDIIKDILEDSGLTSDDYAFKLYNDYKPQEHVCQYQESNLDFISRWMEREGLYYYFEQGESGEKLIITDHKSYHTDLADSAIRYFPTQGSDVTSEECLESLICRHRSLPGKVRMRDYDYGKPTLDVSGTSPVASNSSAEIAVHGARFFTPEEGKKLAKVRAEELLARQVIFLGAGTAFYLRPGYTFDIEDHPRAPLNQKYLTTELEHIGNQSGGSNEIKKLLGDDAGEIYRISVTAIPHSVQFRAESKTTWPRIYGYENGVVDGEADSDYAQIDDQGRYRVKFNFDETDLRNGKASTWVRMMQPHGGDVEGFHFPLRKGTEVLFTFLGGDPDRPVIAGVVPNAVTPSPVTSANHTLNVIQTGGRNRLELEDKAGAQRVTMSTPTQNTYLRMGAPNDDHNFIGRTDGSALLYTGTHFNVEVHAFKEEFVGDYVTEDYKGPLTTTVKNDVKHEFKANKQELVTAGHVDEQYKSQRTDVANLREEHVGGGVTEIYDSTHDTTITSGGRIETVTGDYKQDWSANWNQKIGGSVDQKVSGKVTQNITGDWSVEAAKVDHSVRGAWTTSILGDKVKFTANCTSETLVGIKNENLIGGKIETLVGIKMEALLAGKLELFMGIGVKICSAVELEFAPTKVSGIQAKINQIAGPYVIAGTIWLGTHGIELHA